MALLLQFRCRSIRDNAVLNIWTFVYRLPFYGIVFFFLAVILQSILEWIKTSEYWSLILRILGSFGIFVTSEFLAGILPYAVYKRKKPVARD